jgi:hypothetical protein
MKLKHFPVFLCILVLTLASLACEAMAGAGSTPTPTLTKEPTVKVTNTPEVQLTPTIDPNGPALPEAFSAEGSGIACFGLRDGGVSCLNADGWKTYTKDESEDGSDLKSNYIAHGAVCAGETRLAVTDSDGVNLFDGEEWEHIAKEETYITANAVACGEEGDIWVAHFKGVSHYVEGEDDEWTTYNANELATGDSANDLVLGVAVDGDNDRVWALTSRSVALFEDDKWQIFQKGQGFSDDVFFDAFVLDRSGRPWVGHGTGVYVYDDQNWKLISKIGYESVRGMAFDSKGRLWLGTLDSGAAVYDGKGWIHYNVEGKNLLSDQINGVTADGRGRVWLATSYGLTVFDNDKWETYLMDNSDIADNIVEFAAVIKDGDDIPDKDNKRKASLKGKLVDDDDKEISNARVQLCVKPIGARFTGDTPCSDQPFFLSETTNDDGEFTFNDVPPGYYVLVAETESGWVELTAQLDTDLERLLVEADKDYDFTDEDKDLNVEDEVIILH